MLHKLPAFYLAQLNVARMKAPLDSPLMAGFVSQLESIYSVADRAAGFVWRLRAEDGNSFARLPTGDQRIIITLSVWESREALHNYVYNSEHSELLRNRAQWFEKMDTPSLVLWWTARDTLPRIEQGMARLKYLQRHGASSFAFTFKNWFPPPQA